MLKKKGVMLTDTATGIWLSHSIPNFPPRGEHGYSYPSTGVRYAQQLFCMSYAMPVKKKKNNSKII